MAIFIFLPHI
jgi:hypothetical protein